MGLLGGNGLDAGERRRRRQIERPAALKLQDIARPAADGGVAGAERAGSGDEDVGPRAAGKVILMVSLPAVVSVSLRLARSVFRVASDTPLREMLVALPMKPAAVRSQLVSVIVALKVSVPLVLPVSATLIPPIVAALPTPIV